MLGRSIGNYQVVSKIGEGVRNAVFDPTGMRVGMSVACRVEVVENWCPERDPSCRPEPVTTRQRAESCPAALIPSEATIRTPWGQDYKGTVAFAQSGSAQSPGVVRIAGSQGDSEFAGIVSFKIDWKASSLRQTSLQDDAKLRSGWSVRYGPREVPLTLSDREVGAVRAQLPWSLEPSIGIGDDAAGRPDEHAALTAKLSSAPDANGVNQVALSVTNQGPDPAYKVTAQLRSSSTAIHGTRLSFGVIKRGETKNRITQISITKDTDELNPTVVASVSASNAASVSATSRLRLSVMKRPVLLQLACSALDKESAPGQRVRVQCESSNPGDKPVRGVSVVLAVGAAAPTPAKAPAELAAHARVKFELSAMIPAGVKIGESLPIEISMMAPDLAPLHQQVAIHVVDARAVCKEGKLARPAYLAWRKKMLDALAAGSLTQDEFDAYDADKVACLD
jgi:hypothetical protein